MYFLYTLCLVSKLTAIYYLSDSGKNKAGDSKDQKGQAGSKDNKDQKDQSSGSDNKKDKQEKSSEHKHGGTLGHMKDKVHDHVKGLGH